MNLCILKVKKLSRESNRIPGAYQLRIKFDRQMGPKMADHLLPSKVDRCPVHHTGSRKEKISPLGPEANGHLMAPIFPPFAPEVRKSRIFHFYSSFFFAGSGD